MAVELKDPVSRASTTALGVTKAEALKLEGITALSIDGGTPAIGDRVLLKDQEAAAQNGLWELKTSKTFGGEGNFGGSGNFGEGEGWSFERTTDADSTEEVKRGMLVPVSSGDVNQRTSWMLTSNDPVTVGTTAQTFAALFAIPGGSAGGDLAGTYSEPSVASAESNEFT